MDAGANINAAPRFGDTALIAATIRHNEQLVNMLLDFGLFPDSSQDVSLGVAEWLCFYDEVYFLSVVLKDQKVLMCVSRVCILCVQCPSPSCCALAPGG